MANYDDVDDGTDINDHHGHGDGVVQYDGWYSDVQHSTSSYLGLKFRMDFDC